LAGLELEAEVDLLPTDRGGKSGPVRSGFRPALWFGDTGPHGELELHSAVLRVMRGDHVAPGDKGGVLLLPLAYETWPRVRPGTHFDVYDAGRPIGRGILRTTPTSSASERELRQVLNNALEEWVLERFGDRVLRRPRLGKRFQPDLVAWFDDDEGMRRSLIAEVIARRPGPRDVDRLARMLERHKASVGIIVALDSPSAATLDAIHRHGTIALSSEVRAPKIRVITTRDLVRNDIRLIPTREEPEELELLAG
jgi:hypothetical protein